MTFKALGFRCPTWRVAAILERYMVGVSTRYWPHVVAGAAATESDLETKEHYLQLVQCVIYEYETL